MLPTRNQCHNNAICALSRSIWRSWFHQTNSGFDYSNLMFHSGKFCHDFRKYILWNSFVVNSLVLDSHGKWIHFLKLIWLNTLAAVNNQLIWNASIDNTPSLISFWAETLYIIIATYHLNLKFSVSNFWETAKNIKFVRNISQAA